MKKISLLIFVVFFCFYAMPSHSIESQKLSPIQRAALRLNKKFPKIYKPTKFVVGEESTFKIVAEPQSYVALAYSFSNTGAVIEATELRLGQDFKIVKGIVPENGVLNLSIQVDNKKELIDKKIYIEAIVSQDKDFKTFEVAKIMGSNAREISYNWILIDAPSKTGGSAIVPGIPGASGDAFRALTQREQEEQTEDSLQYEKYYNIEYTDHTPLYLRNMKTEELKNNGSEEE